MNYLNFGPVLNAERTVAKGSREDEELSQSLLAVAEGYIDAAARMMRGDNDVLDMRKIARQRAARRVDYDAGVVTHAVPLFATQVAPSLPPPGTGGSVPLGRVLPARICA